MITNILLLLNAIFYLVPSILDGTLDPIPGANTPIYTKLMAWGNFNNIDINNGEYYRIISSMFLHWGLVHFVFNMVSLYQMGPYVEEKFGSGRMGIIYLVSGLAGGLATYYFGNSGKASAGASGAIFGLVGALISYFLLNQSSLSNAILPQLFLIVAINMYFGFASQNIGNAAHIGGLIGGLIVGYIFAR